MKGLESLTVELNAPTASFIYVRTGFGLSLSTGITEAERQIVLAYEWLSPCCFGFVRAISGWEVTSRVQPNATMYDVVCGQCSTVLPSPYRDHPMVGGAVSFERLVKVATLELDPLLADVAVNGLLKLLDGALATRTVNGLTMATGEHSLVRL